MNDKSREIFEQIATFVGMKESRVDGVYVWLSVSEMYSRTSWGSRDKPMGRYQIKVDMPGKERSKIFRTKKADGSFNIQDVADTIKNVVRIKKAEQARDAAEQSNKAAAEQIRNDYKLKRTYVSAYAGSAGSYVAAAPVEGQVIVQVNFGTVTPDMARKIMAFAQSLEA